MALKRTRGEQHGQDNAVDAEMRRRSRSNTAPSDAGSDASNEPIRRSERAQKKDIERRGIVSRGPPPPDDWSWPEEGDIVEVEIADEFGVASWQKACITVVLVDGWFSAKITTRNDSWEDWFHWKEEGTDWRRRTGKQKPGPAASTAPSQQRLSKSGGATAARIGARPANGEVNASHSLKQTCVLPTSEGKDASVGCAAGEGPTVHSGRDLKLRLRLDHTLAEATLVRPRAKPSRRDKQSRLDVAEGRLPLAPLDERLVGLGVRLLDEQLGWRHGRVVSFGGSDGKKHVLAMAPKGGAEEEQVEVLLPDHKVDLLLEVTPPKLIERDDSEECYVTDDEEVAEDGGGGGGGEAGGGGDAEMAPRRSSRTPKPGRFVEGARGGGGADSSGGAAGAARECHGVPSKERFTRDGRRRLRLIKSKLAPFGFRHVVAFSTSAADAQMQYIAHFYQSGKQTRLGPFETPQVPESALCGRFSIAQGEAWPRVLHTRSSRRDLLLRVTCHASGLCLRLGSEVDAACMDPCFFSVSLVLIGFVSIFSMFALCTPLAALGMSALDAFASFRGPRKWLHPHLATLSRRIPTCL
eukprot:605409-Pleurochrysis_carterae.AAC.1